MIIILLSIFIGLILTQIFLPLGYMAPEWILLTNIYWAIALPTNKKLLLAFISGYLVDILYGHVLGITSLTYVIFIYIILRLYNSLRYMTVAQQTVVISFFILIKQHLFIWSNSVIGVESEYFDFMISAVISGILWPPIYYVLRYIRRKFHIS
jgi:rod shape-determining protein MreD